MAAGKRLDDGLPESLEETYQRVKEAVEVRPSGVPRRSDEELAEILRSPVAVWNAAFGFAALLVITWLMIFKPFQVF